MGKKPAAKAQEEAKKTVAKRAEKAEAKPKKKVVKVESSGESCKIANCKREYRAKGYCGVHYKKWRHGEYGVARYKTCNSMDCRKPMSVNRHGYCEEHYQSFYVKGEKAAANAPATEKPAEKAADKTNAA